MPVQSNDAADEFEESPFGLLLPLTVSNRANELVPVLCVNQVKSAAKPTGITLLSVEFPDHITGTKCSSGRGLLGLGGLRLIWH